MKPLDTGQQWITVLAWYSCHPVCSPRSAGALYNWLWTAVLRFSGRAYLNHWMERVMLNLGGESLGAYPIDHAKEVLSCI